MQNRWEKLVAGVYGLKEGQNLEGAEGRVGRGTGNSQLNVKVNRNQSQRALRWWLEAGGGCGGWMVGGWWRVLRGEGG
jgi:hypothetical protein